MNDNTSRLFLKLASGFECASQVNDDVLHWRDRDGFCIVRNVDKSNRDQILSTAGLKHAKYHAFSSSLSLIGCKKCLNNATFNRNTLGILCVGGPLHCEIAWSFAEMIIKRGWRLANPLYFPNTIASSIPCSVASALGAKAFAFTIGYDHHAFFDVLRYASQAIHLNYAERVLIASPFDANSIVQRSALELRLSAKFGTTAVCGLLEPSLPENSGLLLHNILPSAKSSKEMLHLVNLKNPIPAKNQFCITVENGMVVKTNFESELRNLAVFTATGGVLVMEAAKAMWHKSNQERYEPFLTICEADNRASGIILQWVT